MDSPAKVDFDLVYHRLLCPALEAAGCEPFRADQEHSAGDIRVDMFFELVTADIVVADISALNANVFYELGVRHGVAPNGVFVIHGGWGFARPFDIAPDRTFRYDGALFETGIIQDEAWSAIATSAADQLARTLADAIRSDRQTTGSPVYLHLPGLKPVDWTDLHNARARYFGGLLTDWRQRIRVARANGYPGDILTLAEDAPTRLHRAELLNAAARDLIGLCRFDVARDVLEELLRLSPDDLEARRQLGLVNARLGKTALAIQQMQAVASERRDDPEAQGILGRVYKDMWRASWANGSDLAARRRDAASSQALAAAAVRSYYAALARHPESYYNGINVLTLTSLITDLGGYSPAANLEDVAAMVRFTAGAARRLAQQDSSAEEQIWSLATLGELAVIEGDEREATRRYAEAGCAPGIAPFHRQSMLDQLEMLAALGFNANAVTAAMQALRATMTASLAHPQFRRVFLFSGHMIDAPDRPRPRFPPASEDAVKERLASILDEWDAGPQDLAISGAARGGDILFAELCKRRGAGVRLLLPKRESEFVKESVRLPGADWVRRFDQLADTCEVWFQDDHLGPAPDGASVHARNNLWILNTGRVEAQQARQLYATVVWDEQPGGDGPGGTSHFASEARRLNAHFEIVNPLKL